jgi:Flp pilus assembly protein TadD
VVGEAAGRISMGLRARAAKGIRHASLALVLVCAVGVAYGPALRADFVWDDAEYVVDNPLLGSVEGLGRIWTEPAASPQYYPLVFTTFWAEHRLWGERPFGYHLVNVLLHAGNAILLAVILHALGLRGGWLAAGLFALHPVHVESVAWITERKNVLSTFLYLSALAAYLRHAGLWQPTGASVLPHGASRCRSWTWYGASLAFFVLALLSKTTTAMLAPALALVVWWKRGSVARREGLGTLPFFALGALFGFFTAWFEKEHVLAEGADWALSSVERLLVAGRIVWFYLGKLAWPSDLAFIYPRWEIDAASAWACFPPLGVLALLGILWRLRGRVGRGPFAAALYFAVTLFPALGFFDVYFMRYSYVADHFQYLASLGPLVAVGEGFARLGHGRPRVPRSRAGSGRVVGWLRLAAPGVLLVALGGLVWVRCHAFRDNEAVWRDTLRKNPAAWVAHNNLGVILDERGARAEAEDHYREAIHLRPDYWEAMNNLGLLMAETGKPRQAEALYEAAAKGNPSYAAPLYNLARLSEQEGRLLDAERYYRRAIGADPDLKEPYHGLGALLAGTGRFDEAVACYLDVLVLAPNDVGVRYDLGVALDRAGRSREAASEYRKVLEVEPNHVEALNNLASNVGTGGDMAEAARLFARAVELRPDEAALRVNLARALAAQGRRAEAAEQLAEAVRLAPGDEGMRQELERALGAPR